MGLGPGQSTSVAPTTRRSETKYRGAGRACDCTIILSTIPDGPLLDAAIERLATLTDRGVEVIACTASPSCETPAFAERFPQVRRIVLDRGIGAAACNIAAAAARGWLLVFAGEACDLSVGRMTGLIDLFRNRLDIGAAALSTDSGDADTDLGDLCVGSPLTREFVVRRRAFLDVGGVPIDFGGLHESLDLSCRLWRAGWRLNATDEFLARRDGSSSTVDQDEHARLDVLNRVKVWTRYAPESLMDRVCSWTVDGCQRRATARKALAGFNEGLREARALMSQDRPYRAALSVRQMETLFGWDQARVEIAQWADKHRARSAALWSRGECAEILIDVAVRAGIRISAVYDSVDRPVVWNGLALAPFTSFDPISVDGIIVGTLERNRAGEMARQLRRQFPGVPVATGINTKEVSPMRLAVPA